jgi:hypothetical protein
MPLALSWKIKTAYMTMLDQRHSQAQSFKLVQLWKLHLLTLPVDCYNYHGMVSLPSLFEHGEMEAIEL